MTIPLHTRGLDWHGLCCVRADLGRYYFGDWFDDHCARYGFTPWVDYRIGRGGHDPMFSQYRSQYREPERWEKGIRAVYADRHANPSARPFVDLNQQAPIGAIADIKTRSMLAPLAQASQVAFVKLETLSAKAGAEETKLIQQSLAVRNQRQKLEAEIVAKEAGTQGPRTGKLILPKSPMNSANEAKVPPAPKLPAHEDRPMPKTDPQAKDDLKGAPHPKDVPKEKDEPKPRPKNEPAPKPKDASPPKVEPKPAPPPAEPKSPPPPPKAEPKPSPAPSPAPKRKDKGIVWK